MRFTVYALRFTIIMRCEIISIGTELIASRPGESTPVVCKALSSIGIKVNRITTVGDNTEELSGVLRETMDRSEIIITIGGMGSTPDDITREVVSKTLSIKSGFSRKAMENVARFFSSLGKDVPKCCDSQAEVFKGAELLENTKGSCPGQILELESKKTLILLPGPKEEVEYILRDKLLSFLKEKFERQIKKTSVIHIIGLCEAEVATKLKDVLETERHLEEGDIEFYFESYIGGVNLVIDVWWDNELLVDEILHKTKSEICDILKENIIGEDADTIEGVVGKLLTKKRKTLAVAESCTGGLLSSRITDASGSSIYFKQAVVTYSTNAKVKQLNVNPDIIKEHGAVSEDVAKEMAENMKKISGADYALSVTGYAGSAGGKEAKVGSGYIGLAAPEKTQVKKVEFSGARKKIKEKFTVSALEILWRTLKEEVHSS